MTKLTAKMTATLTKLARVLDLCAKDEEDINPKGWTQMAASRTVLNALERRGLVKSSEAQGYFRITYWALDGQLAELVTAARRHGYEPTIKDNPGMADAFDAAMTGMGLEERAYRG